MRACLLIAIAISLAVTNVGDAQAGVILSVDFGVRDEEPPGSPNQVQSGFEDFSVDPSRAGSDLRNLGVSTESRTFAGIEVLLSGTINGPTFFDISPDVSGANGDLLEDVVRVIGGDLQLQLSGLSAGNYTLTTFHHVSNLSSAPLEFSIDVDTGSGFATVATGVETSFGTSPTFVSTESFQFTADGVNDVTVLFVGSGPPNTISPALNGFTLSDTVIPEPSSVALFAIGSTALFGFGWRRRRKSAP